MEIGIEGIKRIAKTGVTFLIEGCSNGRNISLKADIDVLPILEKNQIDYKSKFDGIMYSCGHDVHTNNFKTDEDAMKIDIGLMRC